MELDYSLREIEDVAKTIIENASSKTLLFYGDLGAGKTTLIKTIVCLLGSDDIVTSPTFSLVNEYKNKKEIMYHFDFYRIENEDEAYDIGFEEYFTSGKWLFIEWPENISNILYGEAISIKIEKNEKTEGKARNVKINSIIL
ncbi:tRNA (adenosine(37)-N6)-threonylcarbamoyltransferase complex ATPase subunit type 1 TsaE [Mesonia sp. K7]|nr:tRNA (adenosine(37)-N6)-threonylcarbamoyltransferase complex ATPase subunit type 1 TsaE [Mesonia sp. K7]PZD78325.1 tRNA (adenosine(37)-N6)-threonylcarbamoyltransferase complex ATPase subunit type 1 TsaE [Mesonia sp. K7]